MTWSTITTENKDDLTDTEVFTAAIPLEPHERAHVEVDVDYIASPTDSVVVSLYGRVNGTDWDDSPFYSITIDKARDPNQLKIPPVGPGIVEFRVGLKMDGSTDTTTDAVVRWKTG